MPNNYNYRFGGWDPPSRHEAAPHVHRPLEHHSFEPEPMARRGFGPGHGRGFGGGRRRDGFPWWVLPFFLDSTKK